MNTELFYMNLPIIDNFIGITDPKNFYSVPSDWYILITDIVGSTKAIESGRYKEVNFLGAGSIVVVLNIAGNLELPFVFGGDGAAILIPPRLFTKAIQALLAIRQRASNEFGMNLRVGAVPVGDVIRAGYDIQIAKIKVSKNYYQAAFTGNGLSYATQLIKNPETAIAYNHENIISAAKADFSGLECRWQDIVTKHEEAVSLIVKAIPRNRELSNQIYQEVIEKIQSLYGDEDFLNPVTKANLNLAFNYKNLKHETQLRAKSGKFFDKLLYFGKIILENILGWFLMTFKIQIADVDWGIYQEQAIATTDYQKFDDMLRMVISGNKIQRKKLTRYLKNNYKKGKLVYGMHISNRLTMTCLVFERNGNQVHFIDGADGGYAAAAKSMKRRIKRIKHKLGSETTLLEWQPPTSLIT